MQPTPDDLARDLEADYLYAVHPWTYYNSRVYHERAALSWPAAIRRALAAETKLRQMDAELAEARRVCDGLAGRLSDNSHMAAVYELQAALERERKAGRNEAARLQRLIELSQDDVRQQRDEVMRLQVIVEGLTGRVAAQSELLARRAEL